MEQWLQQAQQEGIVAFNPLTDEVHYRVTQKKRKISFPEEKVQLATYLRLIYQYHYAPECIRVCYSLKIGSSTREADIVVFADTGLKRPLLVVECKKEGATPGLMEAATEQGFSYTAALQAAYLWVTDGTSNRYFEWRPKAPKERISNRLPDIPKNLQGKGRQWKYPIKKGLFQLRNRLGQRTFRGSLAFFDAFLLVAVAALLFGCMAIAVEGLVDNLAPFAGFSVALKGIFVLLGALVFALSHRLINTFFGEASYVPAKSKKAWYLGWLIEVSCLGLMLLLYRPAWWNETHWQKLSLPVYILIEPFIIVLAGIGLLLWSMGTLQHYRKRLKQSAR